MTRNHKPSLHERRAALEATIEQQRIDTLVAAEQWNDAASPLEARWDTLRHYQTPILVGSGIALTLLLRRPGQSLKLTNRVVMGALTLKRLGKLLP